MRLRRVRPDPERQLALSDAWGIRACQSPLHAGSRNIPADQFVRNGPYLRTVCRLCWATANRGRRDEGPADGLSRADFTRINQQWRPTADHSRKRRRFGHRRAESGLS
jgi:hypothetical protein